jgi:glycosyltransferase involved in cell wall biosynthesis
MDLSVIVCAHNEEDHLGAQLRALADQEWSGTWEVVVVDNRSTDTTPDLVQAFSASNSRFRLVRAPARNGKSYAMAVGVSAAKADLIAFCDADDVVAQGWVAAIAERLADHLVVTGPHELDRLNPSWLADSRGRSIEASVGTFFGLFPCIRGAGWGVHREIWERLGGMDESYAACEDLEFSYRCWLAGVEVVGADEAVVHYRYRTTPRALWRQGMAYGSHRPRIAKRLREAGLPGPPHLAGGKAWILLIWRVRSLTTPEGRAVWTWVAANRWGHVLGSIRSRTLML